MKIYMLLTLITLCAVVESGLISQPSVESEFVFYTDRIRIIYNLLAEECPDWRREETAFKRNMVSSHHLDVEIRLYNELMNELIKCRNGNSLEPATQPQTTPNIPTTTEPTTKEPTTTQTSTTTETVELQPTECLNAVNLTESWRLDHSGSDYKPGGEFSNGGYGCDYNINQWFRFNGDGGSRMLNRCPPINSCGAHAPMWSNSELPDNVGERLEASAYMNYRDDCDYFIRQLSIIRCSHKHNDVIYYLHQERVNMCWVTFCGMN